MNLIVHCGGHRVDRAQVELCPTPERTPTWVPIPHGRLLNEVENTLGRAGLRVVNEAHALSHDGQRYFGLLELANGHGHADYALVLGLRNSHDKTFPAALALGSGVFVCDNLAFSAEIVLARKHTVFIGRDLPQLVSTAMGRLGEARQVQERRITAYQETPLSDAQMHDLAVRALDSRVIPVTKLPEVVSEWRQPRHPVFAQGGRTAWRAFNSFTEVLKGGDLTTLVRRTQSLHGLLDVTCGLQTVNVSRQ